MATHPVSIQRQDDGRHHVIDGEGNVLGKHKSVWSAARQIHLYHSKDETADIHPPVPRLMKDTPTARQTGRPASVRPSIPKPTR